MNTKIVVQHLVNSFHSKAEASLALIQMNSDTLHSIKLGLVTVVLLAAVSVVETKALLALVSADLF